MSDLVDEGVLSQLFLRLPADVFPIDRRLHQHQESAIRKAVAGRNIVVSTGTGSGKTEAFLLPILNGLFEEIEMGTIKHAGVRALLLYPMNALANDQVKRLRRLLEPYPEITFGRYVGETSHTDSRAEDDFRDRYPSEPRIPNELLSRKKMQASPPSILLTNYAMLEYLLLRPDDSAFFDGSNAESWRHLVLDEAHSYDGAQGTEVAMLLRRVRDRIHRSEQGRLQCFATSATMGKGKDDYPKLMNFAEQIFGEKFEWVDNDPRRQDIVEASRLPMGAVTPVFSLPQDRFAPLQSVFRAGGSAADLAQFVLPYAPGMLALDGENPEAYLGRVLAFESTVVSVQQQLANGTIAITPLAGKVFTGPSAENDLVKLVDLAVAARSRESDAPLLPARYHFWVGSLDGGYWCLHPAHPAGKPRLQLHRHETCPECFLLGQASRMIELGVCRSCGAEYTVGKLIDNSEFGDELQLVSDMSMVRDYFLIGDAVDVDVTDDDAELHGDQERTESKRLLFNVETGALNTTDTRIIWQHPKLRSRWWSALIGPSRCIAVQYVVLR